MNLNELANWAQLASAAGTLMAVAVSLYIALRNEWPRLRGMVYRNIDITIGEDRALVGSQLLIEIVNVGTLPVTIRNVHHRAASTFSVLAWTADDGVVSPTAFPRKLAHGESLTVGIQVRNEGEWAKVRNPFQILIMAWVAHTNTSKAIRFRLPVRTAWHLWGDLKAIRAADGTKGAVPAEEISA